jgi:hypothetical protein
LFCTISFAEFEGILLRGILAHVGGEREGLVIGEDGIGEEGTRGINNFANRFFSGIKAGAVRVEGADN